MEPDPLTPLPLAFGEVPAAGFSRARLNVHGVRQAEVGYELAFFANRVAPADGTTPRTPEEGFLGAYVVLGHGTCPGAPGHCDPELPRHPLRPPHHLAPFDVFVDVTAGVRALGAVELRVQMVVLDPLGEPLPTKTAVFDNVSLTFR